MSQLGAAGSIVHFLQFGTASIFSTDLPNQHALDRFSAACDRARMKISTKHTEVLCLPNKTKAMYAASERQYTAAVRDIQVLSSGRLFTSDGRWSEDIDAQIGKANAVRRELGRSVVTKREFQTPQSCHFLIDLCSDSHLWS